MTVDFLLSDLNIIIEANGDFWHANPTIYGKIKPLHRIHHRVIEKDIKKLNQLKLIGYNVIVVWEKDLRENPKEFFNSLLKMIKVSHETSYSVPV